MLIELLIERTDGEYPEKNRTENERQKVVRDRENRTCAGDLNKNDLDPCGARFSKARSNDVDGRFALHF